MRVTEAQRQKKIDAALLVQIERCVEQRRRLAVTPESVAVVAQCVLLRALLLAKPLPRNPRAK